MKDLSLWVQLVGLAAFLAGLFLLVGLAWSLLAGGALLATASIVSEARAPRPNTVKGGE